MNKSTLFFSHSSKDKDMILAIKTKVMKYTSNTLEIFQSSDGESIPFGTNWIHKVEEGLDDAKVMFVFVTENSISSGWIYFEAGYAYSKGIHVIPVGVGVSVGDLKAPLNLLQGFNITSAGGLNNFITIINREFSYDFPELFTPEDYDEIITLSSGSGVVNSHFDEIVRSVKFSLDGIYYEAPGEKKSRDTKKMYEQIREYLDEHKLEYSFTKLHGYGYDKGSCIAVQGIKFVYEAPEKDSSSGTITVSISPYNFEKSFELYLELLANCMENTSAWVQLRLKDNYAYTIADEDCAALLLASPEWFSLSKSRVGSFDCTRLGLHFSVYNDGDQRTRDYVLGISFAPQKIKATSIAELVARLYDLNLIYKTAGGASNA